MVLKVNHLTVNFKVGGENLTAVNDVSFHIGEKESMGLVGESGCGKSTVAFSLMRLLEKNGSVNGEVLINNSDIVSASYKEVRKIRWKDISIVFQNAMSALNPVQKIGDQIINALFQHEKISKKEAIEKAEFLFEQIGLPASRLMQYPHEFSGGMKQRAVIALALICYPDIIVADEPTTALDVVAQKQVINLLIDLKETLNLSMLVISHDISAVSEICEKTAVMYGGQIMEMGETNDVFRRSNHPYTKALVDSFPSLHRSIDKLAQVPGTPPVLGNIPKGCPFAPRCKYAQEICGSAPPPFRSVKNGKLVRCHFAEELDFNNKEVLS